MKPLIGCLIGCSARAEGDRLVVEAPLFTEGKLNKNGQGIPTDEADLFAASLEGKPLRFCKNGFSVDGLNPQHGCDVVGDERSIVGSVLKVYAKERDDEGRRVFYARGVISSPEAVKMFEKGEIPHSWSLYGLGKYRDDAGFIHNAVGSSVSFVDVPAYEEAVIAAGIIEGGIMEEKAKDVANDATSRETFSLPPDFYESLAEKISASVDKKLEEYEARKKVEEERARAASIAASIADLYIAAGTLKPEARNERIAQLSELPVAALSIMEADAKVLVEQVKLAAAQRIAGTDNKPVSEGKQGLTMAAGQKFPKEFVDQLARFDKTPDDYLKMVEKHGSGIDWSKYGVKL